MKDETAAGTKGKEVMKGKGVEKKDGPTTQGYANLTALTALVANKFMSLEFPGINDTYLDQTLTEKQVITKDALKFRRS
jgi:hypothetical protein